MPTRIASFVDEHCYNKERETFVATVGGDSLDASALLLAELGFVHAGRPALRQARCARSKRS